uniref:NADH-ubiquinone oxidoreductase chain 4 n=1 Tax=Bombus ignitus TaxID=130704 RepID=A4UAI2_BOMIG|nr:NADH dehydrogenase subunit 4 [Bombus ignitus]
MNEILILLVIMFFMNYVNFYILSNLMFLMSFYFLVNFSWIKWINIVWGFGDNYYSSYLILMMIWVFGMIFLNLNELKKYCLILNLILFFLMLLNFVAMDLLMFYFMYESSLLLIFFMIMEWGYSEDRILAAFYLMFYTLLFSLPMLYLVFLILEKSGSMIFFFLEIKDFSFDNFNFIYLLMSFLVKIPMYLLHGWLLKAHVEASFFSSMILASVMLKLGSYGMLRLILIFNNKMVNLSFYLMIINLFGMLILSMLCLFQFDMKLIIAMSSIIHMGIMIMGMLSGFMTGLLGSLFMMISHGLVSSGLFYLVNTIYEQTNSRIIFLNKGLMNLMPSMSMMWFMMCVYNSGAPISLNMVSEIFLLMSLIGWYKYLFVFLFFYCLFSFMYSIYLFSFIQFGEIYNLNLNLVNSSLMNFLTLILHLLPLNMFIFKLFF